MVTLLSLPADILRYHIFTKANLDPPSLAISSMVCKRIREFVPSNKRTVKINDAAFEGHFEVVQWLRANGCSWSDLTCEYTALRGHLKILQWLRASGCPWDEWTCAYAAGAGHLEVLQWAIANGCPRNVWICMHAARNGHLNVLQWLRANDYPWNKEMCLSCAMDNRHEHIVRWIAEQT